MGRPHWYTRRDASQADIVDDLRCLGYTVHDVSPLGGDALDLFVGGRHHGLREYVWCQVEVKTEAGELTDGEAEYLARHLGWPIIVARRAEDVARWFGAI